MKGGTIALFGGSFDPVHLGHMNVVRSIIRSMKDIDRVIIMPAAVNPFKTGNAPRASDEDRLAMCRIAFEAIPRCIVSDHEIQRSGVSYTIDTLEWLKSNEPHRRLLLTVGSDSLASLPSWYRAEDIFRIADIAAVSRSREDSERIAAFSEKAGASGARVIIIDTEPFEASSTEIREKIINNQDISCYMDENVVKYIDERNLYRKPW
ncbi:MAG: nicotinate (nicotinamide) nucleotide adenylyltransferase [Huintestinicola sp.]